MKSHLLPYGGRIGRQPQSRRRSTARRTRKLGFDRIEQRRLLATASWDAGGGDSDWNNPLNWDSDTLPGSQDTAVIDLAGSFTLPGTTMTVNGPEAPLAGAVRAAPRVQRCKFRGFGEQ